MNTCMKMILKVRLSRESILKFIAKASLAVLVVAGVFGAPTVHAFRNYSEYAAACRAEGGTPSPSPARCEMPAARSGGSPGDYSGAESAGRRARQWVDCKLFGSGCPDQTDGRQDAGHAANEKGVQAYKKGDWATAISLFQQALQNDPNDPTYRQNLANAQANMANQQAREKAEREAMDRQRQNKVAADNMQQSIQNFAQTLNAAPVSGGLDFDGRTAGTAPSGGNGGNSGGLDFTAAIAMPSQTKSASAAPSGDPRVVDARVPRDGAYLTGQVPELKNSPAADRISKGFQAVINHDWPVALAWWQDALNRDPNNAALKRSVDLAQWMVDKRKAGAAGPATPLGAAIHSASRGDTAGAIRQFELAKAAANPASAPQIDDMINALRQRQAKDANDAKIAAYWSAEIKKGTQKMVDEMFETGMNRLSIGDEKGAQAAFNDATFFGGLSNVRPSQLSAPKPGKSPESAPVFKTLPDGRVLQLPTDSDMELLFPFDPNAQAPTPKTGKAK